MVDRWRRRHLRRACRPSFSRTENCIVLIRVIAAAGTEYASSERWATPFFDYDCVSVAGPLVDWNELHGSAMDLLRRAEIAGVVPEPPPRTGRLLVHHSARALWECPLAVLHLAAAHFHASLARPEGSTPGRASMLALSHELARTVAVGFPVHAICASRWPVFEGLALVSATLPVHPELSCDGVREGVVDWPQLRGLACRWAEVRRVASLHASSTASMQLAENDPLEFELLPVVVKVFRRIDQARLECPAGVLFAMVTQMLVSATRTTQHFTAFSAGVDESLLMEEGGGLLSASSSGWPIFEALAWVSDVNKGKRYVNRDPKYLRRFGDVDLLPEELAPMVGPPRLASGGLPGTVAEAWHADVGRSAATMARLPWRSFACAVLARARGKWSTGAVGRAVEVANGVDNSLGGPAALPARPILVRMLHAILRAAGARQGGTAQRAPSPRACARHRPLRMPRRLRVPRRAVALTLLYGSRWSALLPRVVRRLERLAFSWPLLVVSIGESATGACRRAASHSRRTSLGETRPVRVACWWPNTESQVHRFTIIHVLLHLGIDVFYFDMDTFFFHDPLPSVLTHARRGRWEALFASHADGDCINIGLFLLRATVRTATWFSQFLQWYHDHQYEIDQRGLDVLLGSPRRQSFSDLGVSYPPKNLVRVRAGALDDTNEVVIGFIGWSGDVGDLGVFHWCNLPLKRKWQEIAVVYDAAEAIEGLVPFSVALATVSSRTPAASGPWSLVLAARRVLNTYHLAAPPERLPSSRCW